MSDEPSVVELLQREVAALRAELDALRQGLGVGEVKGSGPLPLRVASLEVVGETPTNPVGRFSITLGIEEYGGALHFTDASAGDSARQAAIISTEEGVSLVLCGPDGVPRAVLSGRAVGGGLSLVDENHDLAAELYGITEASWLSLLHDGAPAAVSVATEQGGNFELFDDTSQPLVVLPQGTAGRYSPE